MRQGLEGRGLASPSPSPTSDSLKTKALGVVWVVEVGPTLINPLGLEDGLDSKVKFGRDLREHLPFPHPTPLNR